MVVGFLQSPDALRLIPVTFAINQNRRGAASSLTSHSPEDLQAPVSDAG